MKIGIMSDSHDNLIMIKKAVQIFNEKAVDFVIHAGDFVAPFSIAPLDNLKCEYIGIFGNNDGEKFGLNKKSNGKILFPPHNVELNDKKILILHEPYEIVSLTKSQVYDIIIHGHTHNHVIEKHERTMVINPGECCGWLTGKGTVVILNINEMEAELIYL